MRERNEETRPVRRLQIELPSFLQDHLDAFDHWDRIYEMLDHMLTDDRIKRIGCVHCSQIVDRALLEDNASWHVFLIIIYIHSRNDDVGAYAMQPAYSFS